MSGQNFPRLAILLAALLSTAGGCTTLTEAQIEEHDYRRSDFRNRFVEDRSRCFARGGRIYIAAGQTLGRDGIPNPGDRYFCA
jgi:hypothetical protein